MLPIGEKYTLVEPIGKKVAFLRQVIRELGLSADVQQKYRVDLKFIDYLGRYKDNGTAVTATNGLTTFLKDRGAVSLTFKTTF